MISSFSKITVYFQAPFWVGIYERMDGDMLSVCKITFGAEPKDYEVYDYFLKNWNRLKFSPPIKEKSFKQTHINPKRLQREIKKSVLGLGVGTKSMQALKLMHDENKMKRKEISKKQIEEEKLKMFNLHKEKKREKHRGH